MIINRIREVRQSRKLTLAQLAQQVGTTATTIQRMERGEVLLVHELLLPVAEALGVSWIELLTRSPAQPDTVAPAGLAESAAAFAPPADHALARTRLADTEALFQVRGEDLSAIGIHAGDVLIVDVGRDAVRDVHTGDVVVAQIYGPGLTDAVTVIRQFVAPALLVANSIAATMPGPIRMTHADAAIKGVARRRFGALPRHP